MKCNILILLNLEENVLILGEKDMYKGKRMIAIIPARKGSKRIKNKNMCEINGKTLVEYSISVAKKSKYIDEVLVSTDSPEIINIAKQNKCIFKWRKTKNIGVR